MAINRDDAGMKFTFGGVEVRPYDPIRDEVRDRRSGRETNRERELQAALQDAQENLEKAGQFIQMVMDEPFTPGIVVADAGERLLVSSPRGIGVVKKPIDWNDKGRVGMHVQVSNKNGAILAVLEDPLPLPASTSVVSELLTDGTVLVEDGRMQVRLACDAAVEVGERVMLDPTGGFVLGVVPRQQKERFDVIQETNVLWSDIGGAEEAKQAMREAVEFPLLHAELYKDYGKRTTKGVLLSGPPGCGKTMLGKAAATAIAARAGKGGGFLYVKGPEILSKWVGESEATVRGLFAACRKHKAKTGNPAVLFIDEADALLGKRGSRMGGASMESTIVPAFLAEMDGIEDSGAIVVLATNRPDALDPAVVREGRIDRRVAVRRPNEEEARAIARIHAQNIRCAKGVTELRASQTAVEALFDQGRHLYEVHLEGGETADFTLSKLVSGAMIAAVFEHAKSIAIRRDVEAGAKKATGVTYADIVAGVDVAFREAKGLNHDDDLSMHVEPVRARVRSIAAVA